MKRWISLLLSLLLVLSLSAIAVAEESDPIGVVDDDIYTNEIFGVEIRLPDNWYFLTDEAMASHMGYAEKYASREGLMALFKEQNNVCGMFAAAKDDPTASMNFMVEDLGVYQYLDEGGYRDLAKDQLAPSLQTQGFSNVEVLEKTFTVAERELVGLTVTASMGSSQFYMLDVLFKADRYMGVLTVASSSVEKTNECLDFLTFLDEQGFQPIEAVIPSLEPAEIAGVTMPDIGTTAEASVDSWSVIGNFLDTSWDTDFPMAEISSGVWQSAPLAMKANNEFKVRMNGSWAYMDYGEGCVAYGNNIVVPEDGVYVVTLDLNAMTLTYTNEEGVQPAVLTPETDSWAIIGTINGTNWDTDFPMQEVLPGVWMSDPLQLKAGNEFKVRLNGNWAVNYGITNGSLVRDGANIRVEKDGLYVVTLNLNDLTLTW